MTLPTLAIARLRRLTATAGGDFPLAVKNVLFSLVERKFKILVALQFFFCVNQHVHQVTLCYFAESAVFAMDNRMQPELMAELYV